MIERDTLYMGDGTGFVATEHGLVGITFDYNGFMTLYFVWAGETRTIEHPVSEADAPFLAKCFAESVKQV